MNSAFKSAMVWLTLAMCTAAAQLFATYQHGWLGESARIAIFIVSFSVAVLSFAISVIYGLRAVGQARLTSGRGVIARWHVGFLEWERFRVFDAARNALEPAAHNELDTRKPAPVEGVDVVFGRRQVLVGDSYHALSGIPHVPAVYWLAAPIEPECLEFVLVYPRGRYGGTFRLRLRVPVPASARDAGIRTYWHYHAAIPKAQPGLVFRHPRRVLGGCLAMAVLAGTVGGIAHLMASRGNQSELITSIAMAGIATGVVCTLMTVVLALAVWFHKKTDDL